MNLTSDNTNPFSTLPPSPESTPFPIWNACHCLHGGYLIRNQDGFRFVPDYDTPLSQRRIRNADHTKINFDITLCYDYQYIPKLNTKPVKYNIKVQNLILDMTMTDMDVYERLKKCDLFWTAIHPKNSLSIPEEILEKIHIDINYRNNFPSTIKVPWFEMVGGESIGYYIVQTTKIIEWPDLGCPLQYLISDTSKK